MYSVYLDFWQSHAWFIHNLHLDHLYYCLDKQAPIAWRNESTTAASALAWPRPGGGGGGLLHKVLYGEALPWGFSAYFALSNPLAFTGCKENRFYSLPFGQVEANIY